MVIKSGKGNRVFTAFGFILGTLVMIYMFIDIPLDREEVRHFIIGFAFFWGVILVRGWMECGRTLIMDREGCTVCFLWFRKKYLWKDLKLKRIEHYYAMSGGGRYNPYTDAAVFSAHAIHKPKNWDAGYYSFLIHPFSFFYVYFSPDFKTDAGFESYEMEEIAFLKQMKDWNVELEETRPRHHRKRA